MITVAVLLLVQAVEPLACTSLEPPPPTASPKVEMMLSRQEHEDRYRRDKRLKGMHEEAEKEAQEAQGNYEQALREAQKAGDRVGEAEASFSLARLTFERTSKWPSAHIEASAASCRIAGCGPAIVRALLDWGRVVGAKDPSYRPAIDTAFQIARDETKRRRAMGRELLQGASLDLYADPTAAAQCMTIAAQLMENEVADAKERNDTIREAEATGFLGKIYTSLKMPNEAADAYSKAAPLWEGAQCRVKEVDVLLQWAESAAPPPVPDGQKDATPPSTSDNYKQSAILGRALSAAEQEDKCQYAINRLLADRSPLWKQVSAEDQKRFLSVRQALASRAVTSGEIASVAEDARKLGNLEVARSLYLDLAHSPCNEDSASYYYGALAEIAKDDGKPQEAASYRSHAALIEANNTGEYESPLRSYNRENYYYSSAGSSVLGVVTSLGGALGVAGGYAREFSAWDPPGEYSEYLIPASEKTSLGGLFGKKSVKKESSTSKEPPGSEGGTPGEKPGAEGGTPGAVDKPQEQ